MSSGRDVIIHSSLPSLHSSTCAPVPSLLSIHVFVHLWSVLFVHLPSRCSLSESLAFLSIILPVSALEFIFLDFVCLPLTFLVPLCLVPVSPGADLFLPPLSLVQF